MTDAQKLLALADRLGHKAILGREAFADDEGHNNPDGVYLCLGDGLQLFDIANNSEQAWDLLAWLLKQRPLHKYEGDTSAAWFEVTSEGVYKMVCTEYEQATVQSWTHDGTASGLRAAVLKAALRVG